VNADYIMAFALLGFLTKTSHTKNPKLRLIGASFIVCMFLVDNVSPFTAFRGDLPKMDRHLLIIGDDAVPTEITRSFE